MPKILFIGTPNALELQALLILKNEHNIGFVLAEDPELSHLLPDQHQLLTDDLLNKLQKELAIRQDEMAEIEASLKIVAASTAKNHSWDKNDKSIYKGKPFKQPKIQRKTKGSFRRRY